MRRSDQRAEPKYRLGAYYEARYLGNWIRVRLIELMCVNNRTLYGCTPAEGRRISMRWFTADELRTKE
jgi:hypothetical protein